MPLDIDSLARVLELEKKRGFKDTAVIGGLDRFLRNWVVRSSASAGSEAEINFLRSVASSRYASLNLSEREAWLGGLLQTLDYGLTRPLTPERKNIRSLTRPGHSSVTSTDLDSPITSVKGIGPGLAQKFNRLGVKTIRDLLYFFPHRHVDYSQVRPVSELTEGEHTIIANVWQAQVTSLGGRRGTEAVLGDETGNIRAVWFNQPYLAKKLSTNMRVVLSGKVKLFRGRPVFESPEWEIPEDKELLHTGRLVPVYPLTEGLYPRQVRKLMKAVIERYACQEEEFLPDEMRRRCGLLDLPIAIAQAHYPDDVSTYNRARTRLAFDELFLMQIAMMARKRAWQTSKPGIPFQIEESLINGFIGSLPFKLTPAQERALGEILGDLQKSKPMIRLLQGDVGSGKTVVATAALVTASANGFQSAFMAPTEILAEQHFKTICGILSNTVNNESPVAVVNGPAGRSLKVALLTGAMTQSQKQEVYQEIMEGQIDIVIGTHALIQKGVRFKKLGMVVVDEQHRFGVAQRAALREKGPRAHMLVMTATPIPRTLAFTLYGDLDFSIINELPAGRQTVKTRWLKPSQRESAYGFIRRQVSAGRQCFIICPLIEESEAVEAQAAVAEYETLTKKAFPELRLGLLHGRMSSAEKDEAMSRFRSGKYDVLVATPVIEVGIDIPNATVILIESAERFGLSQLHQLRGRVGRGMEQSYCMLLADNPSEVARERLDIIERVHDGFILAEEDLKLRGPGEFFGTRQSGMPDLRMARLSDMALLQMARIEATSLFEKDPGLANQKILAEKVARLWSAKEGEFS